jgi:hypothetical protein
VQARPIIAIINLVTEIKSAPLRIICTILEREVPIANAPNETIMTKAAVAPNVFKL